MSVTESTAVAERKPKEIDLVRGALERLRPQLEMALPRHLTPDRLLRVALTAVQNTPKLLECDRTSLYGAIMTCAQLGLEPDGVLGQAYLVPFKGKVQFIPGYKGLLSLARNSGDVVSIAAHEVRDEDNFIFDFASGDPPSHTFDIRAKRGEVIAFYAVARFKDGSFHWDMMTREEVEKIRDGSEGYRYAKRFNKDSPWIEHFVEMGKKTMIRRIAKYLPLSVQKAAALADSYDIGRHVHLDKFGQIVIDGAAQQTEENGAPQIERKQSQLERFERVHAAEGEVEEQQQPSSYLVIDADGEEHEHATPAEVEEAMRAVFEEAKGRGKASLVSAVDNNMALIRRLHEEGLEEMTERLADHHGDLMAELRQAEKQAEEEAASPRAAAETLVKMVAEDTRPRPLADAAAELQPHPTDLANGESDWPRYAEEMVALIQQANPAEARSLRTTALPRLQECRQEDGVAFGRIAAALAEKSRAGAKVPA